MASYVKMTESLFIAIKSLLDAGAKYSEVKKFYGVSDNTCKRVREADSFAEYKQIIAAISAKQIEQKKARKLKELQPVAEKVGAVPASEIPPTPQVVEHKQSVTIQATHYMMQEMQETNRLLKEISNKLAFIVEQLA